MVLTLAHQRNYLFMIIVRTSLHRPLRLNRTLLKQHSLRHLVRAAHHQATPIPLGRVHRLPAMVALIPPETQVHPLRLQERGITIKRRLS